MRHDRCEWVSRPAGTRRWFERLLQELGFDLLIGDVAKIRAGQLRRQKADRRDAEHLLELLESHRFPAIWVPSAEERDLRQLLLHRHKQRIAFVRADQGRHREDAHRFKPVVDSSRPVVVTFSRPAHLI